MTALPEEDRKALLEDGVIPPESPAKDSVSGEERVAATAPMLPMSPLVPHWLQLPDTPGQSLDPRRKIIVLRHPYHEDYVVLPTRQTLRPDNKNIERDIECKRLRDDTSLFR